MKKSLIIIGMMLTAALSLTNCTVEIESPVIEAIPSVNEGIPFELFANPAETKTAITGFATRWTASDEVCVFHAITGESTYYKEGAFSIAEEDLATGRFSGTLNAENTPTEGNNYDWYIVYPYNSYLTSPSAADGRYYIGKRSDQAQVQTGNSTTNHLSGSDFPLYGKATNVAYNESPSITLNPVASIIEVKVTNKKNDPLTVTSVSVTAPSGTSIVGQYTIDFTTNPMTFTNYSTYTSETANLTVNEGAEIAKNEYATFYIGIKPFDVVADAEHPKDLKVSVNGYEKTLSLTRNVSFAPGKIKTISFDFDQVDQVYELVTAVAAFSDGGKYVFGLKDGVSTSIYYFLNNAGTSNTLDTGLTVSENTITNPDAKYVFTAEAASTLFKFKNSSGNYIYNNGSNTTLNTNNATASSWLVSAVDGGYFKFNVSGASGRYIAAATTTPTKVAAYATSNFENQHSGTPAAIAQYSGAWSVFKLGGYVPEKGISNETVSDMSARGASGITKTVTLTNYDSAPSLSATPDGTVVTSASVTATSSTSATITYTVAPNYSGVAAAGSIIVADTDSHSGTITINQVADVFSTTAADPLVIGQASGATKGCTIKSDFDWTIDDSNLTGATVTPTSFTYSSSQSQSITFTTTAANAETTPANLGYIVVTRAGDGATLTINLQQQGVSVGEVLPFNWDGGKSEGTVNMTIAAGSDYGSAPKVKLQTANSHYITVRIASAATQMSFLAKQNGTATNSVITLAGSINGSSFTDIETFTINPGNGSTETYTSSNSINSSYRYLRIMLTTKGTSTNIGVGSLHIE
jgi:hypothetical protein